MDDIEKGKRAEDVRKFGHGLASYSGTSTRYRGVRLIIPGARLTYPRIRDTPSSVSAAMEISIQHCVIPDRSESRSHVTDADTLGMYFNPSYWRYIFEEHAAGVS